MRFCVIVSAGMGKTCWFLPMAYAERLCWDWAESAERVLNWWAEQLFLTPYAESLPVLDRQSRVADFGYKNDFDWINGAQGFMLTEKLLSEKILIDIDDNLFERPLGPTVDCFSTSQIVRMIDAGTSGAELQHLFACHACNELVSKSSQVVKRQAHEQTPAKDGLVASVLGTLLGREVQHDRSPLAEVAVLSIDDPIVEIRDGLGDVCITVALPCSTPDGAGLDATTLRLDGAIRSISGEIESTQEIGSTRFTRVTFRNGHLSRQVKKSLASHAQVTDQVRVSGVIDDSDSKVFAGTAKVEFVASRTDDSIR